MPSIVDAYTGQARCLHVERNIGSGKVKELMMQLVQEYGSPAFIRSGNGPEFIGKFLQGTSNQNTLH
jgi:putative transposase